MSTSDEFRAVGDEQGFRALMDDADVRRSAAAVVTAGEQSKVRRQLLASAVRLTDVLAPALHRIVDACREKLAVEEPCECYVYASAEANAGVTLPDQGRVLLLFSSALLDRFAEDELTFVVGHELGHHRYRHHQLPVKGVITSESVGAQSAMQLFSWSRFAEVSADRAGLYCAGNLEPVARSLFKLASGLSGALTPHVVEAMLAQLEEFAVDTPQGADDAGRGEWFSTHPFSPLRVKAAHLFARSAYMVGGGLGPAALEVATNEAMGLMEPGYLQAKTPEAQAMRRVLLSAGVTVASASGEISDEEIDALDRLLGDGTYSRKLSLRALTEALPERIRDLEGVGRAARMQLVRDLALIALADGHVDAAERAVLEDVARQMGVGLEVVTRVLDGRIDLD
jgi:tellurite resistance protein